MMTLNDYQERAMSTRTKTCDNVLYMLLEIGSESGELQGKFAKAIRKDTGEFDLNDFKSKMSSDDYASWLEDVLHEVGDVLWGVAGICEELGFSLEEVARMNLAKLADRQKRGVIIGEGDNR